MSSYSRYQIPTRPAPNRTSHPSRFRVHVNRLQLAKLLLTELVHYRANLPVVLSRPCVYGVFSGPVGGFAPRPQLCVGCLRCTVQYPDIVQIEPNPARLRLGDSYFTPEQVDTVLYEAATGHVPVRGAGYRGAFGGTGWDGMWTDMSEIVRPTRDGIHGREFISTAVDLGAKPAFLIFDEHGQAAGELPQTISLPLPLLFDAPPPSAESEALYRALVSAAEGLASLAIIPIRRVVEHQLRSASVVPLVSPADHDLLERLPPGVRMIELEGWDEALHGALRERYPHVLLSVRHALRGPASSGPLPGSSAGEADAEAVVHLIEQGVRVIHLIGSYHGQAGHAVVGDALRAIHERLVAECLREQCTLICGGGIVAAEHVPKAIICGVDAVSLDTAALVALQGRLRGECTERASAVVELPAVPEAWAAQRLMNLAASWRDQLLEVLGAMGLREVRRLRGELGRAMFQADLEREAFAGIEGYA